jgi:hypothetical protein
MLLQIFSVVGTIAISEDFLGLIEKYKTKGIIKKYDNGVCGNYFEPFEWI